MTQVGYEQRKALKLHTCDWCATHIVAGEEYQRWMWMDGRDAIPTKVHMDCLAAIDRERRGYFDYEWSPGERKRGMTMDETEASND